MQQKYIFIDIDLWKCYSNRKKNKNDQVRDHKNAEGGKYDSLSWKQ